MQWSNNLQVPPNHIDTHQATMDQQLKNVSNHGGHTKRNGSTTYKRLQTIQAFSNQWINKLHAPPNHTSILKSMDQQLTSASKPYKHSQINGSTTYKRLQTIEAFSNQWINNLQAPPNHTRILKSMDQQLTSASNSYRHSPEIKVHQKLTKRRQD